LADKISNSKFSGCIHITQSLQQLASRKSPESDL